jgi:hypothetical protein
VLIVNKHALWNTGRRVDRQTKPILADICTNRLLSRCPDGKNILITDVYTDKQTHMLGTGRREK